MKDGKNRVIRGAMDFCKAFAANCLVHFNFSSNVPMQTASLIIFKILKVALVFCLIH
jgi:hypothetical protein